VKGRGDLKDLYMFHTICDSSEWIRYWSGDLMGLSGGEDKVYNRVPGTAATLWSKSISRSPGQRLAATS
ncbi:Hypothetical protein FKW44_009109, partial [Caligus rogercresseyi]